MAPHFRSRRLLPIGLVLALSLSTTACRISAAPAASVNGTAIEATVIADLIDAFGSAIPGAKESLDGAGKGTNNAEVARQLLTGLIGLQAASDAAADEGVIANDDDRAAGETFLKTQFLYSGEQDQAQVEAGSTIGDKIFGALSDSTRAWLVERAADRNALERWLAEQPLTDELADVTQQTYEANKEQFVLHCFHYIATDAATAPAVSSRLQAGEGFAELAAEFTADAGYELQCQPASALMDPTVPAEVQALVESEPGKTLGPVDGEGGAVLFLLVEPDQQQSYEDVLPQLQQQLHSQQTSLYLSDAVNDADVSINRRYGRWDSQSKQVVSPTVTPSGEQK